MNTQLGANLLFFLQILAFAERLSQSSNARDEFCSAVVCTRVGFGRLKAQPRSTICVAYAPSPRGSPAASRRRLARVVVRVRPIATRARGTPRRACATYKGVEISVLSGPIPDVSMSMDGKFHDIPFFGNDVVVRVRDTHVPNENVRAWNFARKMIGLKKA